MPCKKTNKSKSGLMSSKDKREIKFELPGYLCGTGYSIEYERDGKIYKHRLKKSKLLAGKGFIILIDPSIKMTKRGIVGG